MESSEESTMNAISYRPGDVRSVRFIRVKVRPTPLCFLLLMALMANPARTYTQQTGQPAKEPKPHSAAQQIEAPPSGKDTDSSLNASSKSIGPKVFKERAVREGIAIEFSMEPVGADKHSSGEFREGDDVLFRFRISDTAGDSPLSGAYPAAWMDLRPEGKNADDRRCVDRVKSLLSGSIFSAAELDLNVYYVLALNDDATITVVDPLFGFSGTKLLAMISLKSPGEDWALTSDQSRLFVSMPASNQVAVINTSDWKLIADLDAGTGPARLALQPDEQYLWVGTEGSGSKAEGSGVAVITAAGLQVVKHIPTGRGPHDIAISNDNRFAFVTNRDEGTVSVIDIRKLQKIGDVTTGERPISVAFSAISRPAYVVNEGDGTIVAVDANKQEIAARMQAEPGLGPIKFAPGGRLGFVVNPEKDVIHILDAATNRIVQTGDVEDGPDQVAFSDELAYVRHRGSEIVLMIPLDEVGVEGKQLPVVDFPGGQTPFGKGRKPCPADAIVQAPGANAVLVANPADRAIYFYKEGMAAPMGNFSNYSREPRAVLVVDRSLKERRPGVYETIAKLRRPGIYDVAFFMNAPRVVHCFEVPVAAIPEMAAKRKGPAAHVEPAVENRILQTGQKVRLRFRLTDPETGQPMANLRDVRFLAVLAPGIWHKRHGAEPAGDGFYEIDFAPPQSGIYYVYLECLSLGLTFNNPHYLVLQAASAEGAQK